MIITDKQYRLLKAVVNNEPYDYENNIDTFDILTKHGIVNRFQNIIEPNENTCIAIEEYERYIKSVERDEKNIRIAEKANSFSKMAAIVGWIGLGISIVAIIVSAFTS